MTPSSTKLVLCLVQGVPKSRTTVTKAIDLALEHDAKLTFAHINNADFLVSATPAMASLSSIYKQMRNLSEFSMLVLCDRAKRRGVKNVDALNRDGKIVPQIRSLLFELTPDILVIGRPELSGSPTASLTSETFDNFIAEITKAHPIEVFAIDFQDKEDES
jgi:hypothetical protein